MIATAKKLRRVELTVDASWRKINPKSHFVIERSDGDQAWIAQPVCWP
jgi:hypothetical protein